jgi:hypothetical protein
MESNFKVLQKRPDVISVLELKKLMVELKDKRPDICVRFRLLGEMWAQNFMRVLHVSEKKVMLNDEVANKLVILPDLSNIMQFELENRFQNYQPFFHYDVIPDAELS